jgi:hypothetical protein
MNTYRWPSREEWAKIQRAPYWDLFEDLEVSTELKDYATPEEIASVVTALKTLYLAEGRKMKDAKSVAGPLARQPGETGRQYGQRCLGQMSNSEREIAHTVGDHQDIRKEPLRCFVWVVLRLGHGGDC